jgi:hypothetical protein
LYVVDRASMEGKSIRVAMTNIRNLIYWPLKACQRRSNGRWEMNFSYLATLTSEEVPFLDGI